MPTIIDSLIVRLGIDAKGSAKQAAPVAKQLNDIEKQGSKATKSVGELTGSLGKFLALIGSTLAIRAFVEDTINTAAAVDRLSKNLNLGAGDITAWGNAAEELGGSAKGLQGSLSMLSREQTNLRVKGESSLLPYFSMLKVNLTDAGLAARPTTDILLDLASAMSHYDRQTGHNILADMGFDEGTINLVMQGRKELELTLARQKDYGAQVAKFAPEATKLQRGLVDTKQGFTLLGLSLLHDASPALETVLGWFRKVGEWARDNSQFIGDFLTVIGAGLGAIGLAALPIDGVVVGIAALAAGLVLLYQDYQTWKRGGDSFIDWQVWKDRVDAVTASVHKLRSALESIEDKATKKLRQNETFRKFDDWFTNKGDAKAVGNAASSAGSAIGKALGVRSGATVEQARAQALRVSAQTGISPDILLAQWEHETGNFTNRGAKSLNNLAGVNVPGGKGEDYRSFKSLDEFGDYYAGMMKRKYPDALGAQDVDTFAKALKKGGYFGDSLQNYEKGMSSHLAGIQGASSNVAAAGGLASPSSSSNDNSVTNHVGEIKVYTAATDANGIARDMTRSMDFLFTSQANSGLF